MARQDFCLGFEVAAGMAGGFDGWRLALETVGGAEAVGASALTDFTVGAVAFAADLAGVSVSTTDFGLSWFWALRQPWPLLWFSLVP